MKKALIYGAGNIGRGFIGQLFFQSGYFATFIDVNETLIDELNKRQSYPLRILEDNADRDLLIKNVKAQDARDRAAAAQHIAEADIMATAVGAEVLPLIAPVIAEGLIRRFELGALPLDILICENLKNAGSVLGGLVRNNLTENTRPWFDSNIGLVETSIGRMVPLQTPELMDGDPLRISVEAYSELPADKEAFRNGIPDIDGLKPYSPFSFYVDRKLYIHNMGHALTAYHGDVLGLEFIWQAIVNPAIKASVRRAMLSSADAIAISYGVDKADLYNHVEDLLQRFCNRKLGDTVYRVGRGIRRKLAPEDRLIGALRLCQKAGTDTGDLLRGISLALRFSHSDLDMPPDMALGGICGIDREEDAYKQIIGYYNAIAADGQP